MKVKETTKAYIAGFLDGDGSIYVKLTQNDSYRYKYQICPYVVFYQSKGNKFVLEKMRRLIQIGYIRERKDGICEYIIGDVNSIEKLVKYIKSYVILKRNHVRLMLDILNKKKKIKNAKDFLEVCILIDKFKKLNYSKKRTNTTEQVRKILKQKGLLTP
ncbi:hypothetical protein KAU51_00520 [Candidatus Parcubacteria bacterium]|nr:hypothetical protein [Candidatus Parcubacteria bacterium]